MSKNKKLGDLKITYRKDEYLAFKFFNEKFASTVFNRINKNLDPSKFKLEGKKIIVFKSDGPGTSGSYVALDKELAVAFPNEETASTFHNILGFKRKGEAHIHSQKPTTIYFQQKFISSEFAGTEVCKQFNLKLIYKKGSDILQNLSLSINTDSIEYYKCTKEALDKLAACERKDSVELRNYIYKEYSAQNIADKLKGLYDNINNRKNDMLSYITKHKDAGAEKVADNLPAKNGEAVEPCNDLPTEKVADNLPANNREGTEPDQNIKSLEHNVRQQIESIFEKYNAELNEFETTLCSISLDNMGELGNEYNIEDYF